MRIVTLVDNCAGLPYAQSKVIKSSSTKTKGVFAVHGLSLFVENDKGHKILIDTGPSETVILNNLETMDLKPTDFQAVFITHGHFDHVGGLIPFIKEKIPIFTHPMTFKGKRYSLRANTKVDISSPTNVLEALFQAKMNLFSTSIELMPGVKTSGEIPRITDFERPLNFLRDERDKITEDFIIEEQAIYISTKKGLVIITGCAHSGIVNIVTHAKRTTGSKIHMVIGGLHLGEASQERIRITMDQLKNLGVDKIAPLHCSGFN
ncbi:MAG: MBL fold metallo-hydrolase, partial [Methanomassiliicoccales archaeon]